MTDICYKWFWPWVLRVSAIWFKNMHVLYRGELPPQPRT